MSFNILNIENVLPETYDFYFCDANIWIAVVKYFGDKNLKQHEEQYADFVNDIIITHNNPDIKSRPKIILTSIVLSETLNAYLKIAMKNYFESNSLPLPTDFKNNYRDNFNSDYKKQLRDFITDIKGFEDYIENWSDDFRNINPFILLEEMPLKTDFNDYYYFRLLKGKSIPIITHDADFLLEDIPIITNNKKLLKNTKY